MHLPFWLTTALLAPIVVYQGKRTRQRTLRLPEASGRHRVSMGPAPRYSNCWCWGNPPPPGWAWRVMNRAWPANWPPAAPRDRPDHCLAHPRDQRRHSGPPEPTAGAGRPAAGGRGATEHGGKRHHRLTPRHRFRQQLLALRQRLVARQPALANTPLHLLSVPPMHRFTALPSPLRQLLGWRARQLDAQYRHLAQQQPRDFAYLGYPAMTGPELLARDGYHPSEAGYQAIAGSPGRPGLGAATIRARATTAAAR